jgi:hypothetical protein
VKTVIELTYRGCKYQYRDRLSEQKIETEKTIDDRVTLTYRGRKYERTIHDREKQKSYLANDNDIGEKIKLIYRAREYNLNVS